MLGRLQSPQRTYIVYGLPSATNTLGFIMSKLIMPRKWALPFTNTVVEVLFRRQNKRSHLLFVSIFMFSCAHWNCTCMVILSLLLICNTSSRHLFFDKCTWSNFQHAHSISWSSKLISTRAHQQPQCITRSSRCVETVHMKFIFHI